MQKDNNEDAIITDTKTVCLRLKENTLKMWTQQFFLSSTWRKLAQRLDSHDSTAYKEAAELLKKYDCDTDIANAFWKNGLIQRNKPQACVGSNRLIIFKENIEHL